MALHSRKKKTRVKRRLNVSRVKPYYTYSIQEVCELFNVHKNTVYRWVKEGLKPLDNQKPLLLFGTHLKEFLQTRQDNKRQKCTPLEMFCVKCQKPQIPWGNIADIKIHNQKQLMLTGLCPVCSKKMNRWGSTSQLPHYQNQFFIQQQVDLRVMDINNTCAISEKKKGTQT